MKLRYAPIDDLAADCRTYGMNEYIQDSMICAGSTTGEIALKNKKSEFHCASLLGIV